VFLAISAPLLRARLRQQLQLEPGIEIVGEAPTAALSASYALEADPQFMLCDERVLADPELERFAQQRSRSGTPKFVLMTSNPQLVVYRGPVPVTLALRIDATGAEMREQLAAALEPPPVLPPGSITEMEDRFFVVGGAASRFAAERDSDLVINPNRTRELSPRERSGPPATHLLRSSGRRQQADEYAVLVDRLSVVLEQLEKHRDSVTGLASSIALDSALRALRGTEGPSAVVVLQLRYARPAGMRTIDLDEAVLQSAGAALKANIRSEDLACRLDGANFATVMPGLGEQNAARPIQRIRAALTRLPHDLTGRAPLEAAVGVGYWLPSMRGAADLLEQAWQAMIDDARLLASQPDATD
jgi:GGDEF domain-containing protein